MKHIMVLNSYNNFANAESKLLDIRNSWLETIKDVWYDNTFVKVRLSDITVKYFIDFVADTYYVVQQIEKE